MAEALDALGVAGWPMVCLTNKSRGYALDLLQAKGLAAGFQAVWGGDSFARKKPDPLPLIETARGLAVAPHELLMVGDSLNDAQAARAAGCPVVLVSYGYNHGQPVAAAGADACIDRLTDVLSLLSRARLP